jgi:hypothetical protein
LDDVNATFSSLLAGTMLLAAKRSTSTARARSCAIGAVGIVFDASLAFTGAPVARRVV